ncbi:unnamed protein product [Amoebophrya sp. A120]|nr:unnamed protein product [Amoebophrya sp. A120]|eukprot:GSA120T00001518001.1
MAWTHSYYARGCRAVQLTGAAGTSVSVYASSCQGQNRTREKKNEHAVEDESVSRGPSAGRTWTHRNAGFWFTPRRSLPRGQSQQLHDGTTNSYSGFVHSCTKSSCSSHDPTSTTRGPRLFPFFSTKTSHRPRPPVLCEWKFAGQVAEFQDGTVHRVEFPQTNYEPTVVSLARTEGRIYCVGASCSHYSAPLYHGVVDKHTITCPWHDAAFDLRTGRPVRGPVLDAIPVYKVKLVEEAVYVDIPTNHEPDFVLPKRAVLDFTKDPRRFLLVGGGAAAASCIEELRASGFQGEIVLVSEEPNTPIDRPVLSKNMLRRKRELLLRDRSFYSEELGVDLRLGCTVTKLDPKAKQVTLVKSKTTLEVGVSTSGSSSGAAETDQDQIVLPYDKCLVCTGGRPRVTVPGALPLRTAADAAAIAERTNQQEQVVIAGGGFIGVECASALKRKGCDVTVVSPDEFPFQRLLGKAIGARILALLQTKDIKFVPKAKVFGDGANNVVASAGRAGASTTKKTTVTVTPTAASEATASSYPLSCDLVIAATGIVPNGEMVSGEEIEKCSDGSILTDSFLRTSADDLFAAGDVATVLTGDGSARRRIEHWGLAQTHGRLAARAMLDLQALEQGELVPFFWTVVCGKTIKYAGYCTAPGSSTSASSQASKGTTSSSTASSQQVHSHINWAGPDVEVVHLSQQPASGSTTARTTAASSPCRKRILIRGDLNSMFFAAYFCVDGKVQAVASMGIQEPITLAAAELMKRGQMLTEDDLLANRDQVIQRLRKLNKKEEVLTTSSSREV